MKHMKKFQTITMVVLVVFGFTGWASGAKPVKTTTTSPTANTATSVAIESMVASTTDVSVTSDVVPVTKVKKTVLFQQSVTKEGRNQYASEWAAFGVTVLMDLPSINGMVLSVPGTIPSSDLASDGRVLNVVDDNQPVTLQALTATADGGSADGGSADGGSADGGSISTSYLTSVPDPGREYRSWGMLRMYEQLYDPAASAGMVDYNAIPNSIYTAQTYAYRNKVKIAVFDSGVDTSHPNLVRTITGGIDLVNMQAGIPVDDNGHGTHVAGTLVAHSASGNEQYGMLPKVNIYSVKVLDKNAIGDPSTLAMALQWAIDNGIHVINMSVAYSQDNPAVRLAVKKAYEAGIVMVAAAGNHSNWDLPAPSASADGGSADGGSADGGSADGGSADGGSADGGSADGGSVSSTTTVVNPYPVMYPAAYPEVIAVASLDAYGNLSAFSNTGPEVDVLAPGNNMLSVNLDGQFGVCSGTSMAVPFVTATAALMKGLNPALKPNEVKEIIQLTALNGEVKLHSALTEVWSRLGNLRF